MPLRRVRSPFSYFRKSDYVQRGQIITYFSTVVFLEGLATLVACCHRDLNSVDSKVKVKSEVGGTDAIPKGEATAIVARKIFPAI